MSVFRMSMTRPLDREANVPEKAVTLREEVKDLHRELCMSTMVSATCYTALLAEKVQAILSRHPADEKGAARMLLMDLAAERALADRLGQALERVFAARVSSNVRDWTDAMDLAKSALSEWKKRRPEVANAE